MKDEDEIQRERRGCEDGEVMNEAVDGGQEDERHGEEAEEEVTLLMLVKVDNDRDGSG